MLNVGRPEMNDSALDDLILSRAGEHWQKVAMLIVRVTRDERCVFSEKVDEFEVVGKRIRSLVHAGRLASQGDTSEWRFSEVRLTSCVSP